MRNQRANNQNRGQRNDPSGSRSDYRSENRDHRANSPSDLRNFRRDELNSRDSYNHQRSGYSIEDAPYSSRNSNFANRSRNDQEFDRYASRSPSSSGGGQSFNYTQMPDYGSSSHSGESYYGNRSGADNPGTEHFNQEHGYGTSADSSRDPFYKGRSLGRYDQGNRAFRPHNPPPHSYESRYGSESSARENDNIRARFAYSHEYRPQNERGNSYDYDRFSHASEQEPYADQWQAYGTMNRNSTLTDWGRDRNRYAGKGPRSFKRSDERIQDDVCEMLTRDGDIDAEDIDVQVSNGEVILSGTIVDRQMKHHVENCVERCFGVQEVTNNLRIKKNHDEGSQSTFSSQTSDSSLSDTTGAKSPSGKKGSTGVSGTSATSESSTNTQNH